MDTQFSCTQCGKAFSTSESLEQHAQAKHFEHSAIAKQARGQNQLVKKIGGNIKLIAVIAVALVLIYGFVSLLGSSNGGYPPLPPKLADGEIHYHPKLSIYVDGVLQIIPKNVGVGSTHYPLHTHEADNVIHVESPDTRDFTLGIFFKVWQKKFSSDCVMNYCKPAYDISMTVDGKPSQEFENLVLRDGQQITLNVTKKR